MVCLFFDRKTGMAFFLACSLLVNHAIPIVYANSVNEWAKQDEQLEKAKAKMEGFSSYDEAFQFMDKFLNNVRSSRSLDEARNFIRHLVFYPTTEWGNVEKVLFAEKMAHAIMFLNPEKDRGSVLLYALDLFYLRMKETKDSADYDAALEFYKRLSDEKKKEWESKLAEMKSWIDPVSPSDDSGWLDPDGDIQYDPDIFKNPPKQSGNNYKPGYDEDTLKDDQDKTTFPSIPSGERKPQVPKDLSRIDILKDPNSFRNNGLYGKFSSWFDLTKQKGSSNVERGNETSPSQASGGLFVRKQNNKQALSQVTIQYTLNKKEDSPAYEDTGIRVSEDMFISYRQARDALQTIAIRGKGQFVDDSTQSLALMEGRLIVLRESDFPMRAEAFVSLFDDMEKVGVRILDTRIGKKSPILDLAESYYVTLVWIKGKEVELPQELIVENAVVLFPVRTVSEHIGATIEEREGKIFVRMNGKEVVYATNSNVVTINGKEKKLKAKVIVTQKGVKMVDILPMLEAFGLSLDVDTKTQKITINNRR